MAEESKPNIILIVLDALRAKHLSCYGYHRNTSPNIDKLAKNGILFENAFAFNNTTDRSFVSILGGRYMLSSGDSDFLLQKEELDAFFNSGGGFLQEILQKNGYKTYRMADLQNWRKRGFDFYLKGSEKKANKIEDTIQFIKKLPVVSKISQSVFYILPRRITDKISIRHGGPKTTEEAIKIIKEKDGNDRFFLCIDYNDTHMPYNAPGKFAHRFKPEKKSESFIKEISKKNYPKELIEFYKTGTDRRDTMADISARYDCAISYDDHLIGKVIDALKEKKLLDKTIILLISDHGESLEEHEIYFDHHGLHDVTVNIPLIISGKSLPKDKRIKALVQLEDLAPTILDLVRIKYDPSIFDGKSLLDVMNGKKDKVRDFVFMEESYQSRKSAIRNHDYKYAEALSKEKAVCKRCKMIHGGVLELYDLKKDPGEVNNIALINKEIVMKMSSILHQKIQDIKHANEQRRVNQAISGL
ncbi:MAG: sulfatase [Nanoarchaeota archaeon]|nr:sulfatase [Nanoarchaeota archaeon]